MAELDPDRIALAALALLDAKGQAGFTMRAVADALGVTPMAIYHHVKDKAALAALVIDTATSRYPPPALSGDWREDMWGVARWMRESTLLHPALGPLRSAYQIWTPAMLQITDRWVGLWRQSGLAQETAVRAATLSSMTIVGLVDQEMVLRRMQLPHEDMIVRLPDARDVFFTTRDHAADFETVIRAAIDGLHARLMGLEAGTAPLGLPPPEAVEPHSRRPPASIGSTNTGVVE